MISKVIMSNDEYATCKYLLDGRDQAKVIYTNGVRDYNHKVIAEDININSRQQPNINKHVIHSILSFPHNEKPTDKEMIQYGTEYLKLLNLHNSPAVFVRHDDKNNPHFHILTTLIDKHGNKVNDSWIGLRGKKAAQEITAKHNLVPAIKKNLGRTSLSALNPKLSAKYKTYMILKHTIKKCSNFKQLDFELRKQNIEMQFKFKRGSTTEIQGISFRYSDKYVFKGSEIDRSFSYKNIEKTLDYNSLKTEKTHIHSTTNENYETTQDNNLIHNSCSQINLDGISNLIDNLNVGGSNNQIDEDAKRKKLKKRKRPRL